MNMNDIGIKARKASRIISNLSTDVKKDSLITASKSLIDNIDMILSANDKDIKKARDNHMSKGLIDRLKLNESRIKAMADSMIDIVGLSDPVGEQIEKFTRPNGLIITKIRVPIGVIGIIYEARPNVTSDAFALCFMAGNAVILRGGSAALNSNKAIANSICSSIKKIGIPSDALQLIESESREDAIEMMHLNQYIDCLIPRGSSKLIQEVIKESTVPVIETGAGNCHIYVDSPADIDMAIDIISNAKTQRIGVCNACESLVINKEIEDRLLIPLKERLDKHNVEIRADEYARKILPSLSSASDDDWGKEYLDYIISLKSVDTIDEAIEHINRYSTGHSESIITSDEKHATKFLEEIDSACVYVNASTRFTDGGEFGLGGEIGISTQKLHARGPMGLRELTSSKYIIKGNGQVR